MPQIRTLEGDCQAARQAAWQYLLSGDFEPVFINSRLNGYFTPRRITAVPAQLGWGFKLPSFKMPSFKAPSFKMPKFQMPNFKPPKLPSFKMPKMPPLKVSIPKPPSLKLPALKMPKMNLNVKLPTLDPSAAVNSFFKGWENTTGQFIDSATNIATRPFEAIADKAGGIATGLIDRILPQQQMMPEQAQEGYADPYAAQGYADPYSDPYAQSDDPYAAQGWFPDGSGLYYNEAGQWMDPASGQIYDPATGAWTGGGTDPYAEQGYSDPYAQSDPYSDPYAQEYAA